MVNGLVYDTDDGIIWTATRMANTVIPKVIFDKEFVMLLFLNLMIRTLRFLDYYHPQHHHLELPWGLTGVTGSLMTFFVCFYNGHVFKRYNKLYEITQGLCESVLEVCMKLRIEIPDRGLQRKVAKLVFASCMLFFFELSGDKSESQISHSEWRQLIGLGLLDHTEIKHLRMQCRRLQEDALPSLILLVWAMCLLRHHTIEPNGREDMLAGFYAKLLHIRACQATVVQFLELPMPFQYFHIMNLMLILNLVLWGYSLGCQDSYFAPLIFMFVQMMFQGIRELSTSLSNPFGEDDVDFAIDQWVVTLYKRIWGIIESDFDPKNHKVNATKELMHPRDVRPLVDVTCDQLHTDH